jgi:hypothetical protein
MVRIRCGRFRQATGCSATGDERSPARALTTCSLLEHCTRPVPGLAG